MSDQAWLDLLRKRAALVDMIDRDLAGDTPAPRMKIRPDKRDECGCHRECTTLPHECATPCQWPACLTEAEHRQLAAEITPGAPVDWPARFRAAAEVADGLHAGNLLFATGDELACLPTETVESIGRALSGEATR